MKSSMNTIIDNLRNILVNQNYQIMQLNYITDELGNIGNGISEINIRLANINDSIRESITTIIELERKKIASTWNLNKRFNSYYNLSVNAIAANNEYRRNRLANREKFLLNLNRNNEINSDIRNIILDINEARFLSGQLVGVNDFSEKIYY